MSEAQRSEREGDTREAGIELQPKQSIGRESQARPPSRSPTNERVQVIGFDHVVLRCADVEASLAFYCGELGLEPDRVEEWRRGEAFFPSARVDATTLIDLFPVGDGPPRPDVPNVDHLCLVVEPVDLDALAERFPGARRADGLYGAQGLASSLYVLDPDGNTVELRSY